MRLSKVRAICQSPVQCEKRLIIRAINFGKLWKFAKVRGAIILKKNFLDSLTENKDILKALAFVLLLVKIWKIFKITQKQKDNAPPIIGVSYLFLCYWAIPDAYG